MYLKYRNIVISVFFMIHLLFISGVVYAEDVFPKIGVGAVLEYETASRHRPEQLRLEIDSYWGSGLTWRYSYYYRGELEAEGIDTIYSLDRCTNVAPWMVPTDELDDSCDFWLSTEEYESLISSGRAYIYASDSDEHNLVRLENPKSVLYSVNIDGKDVQIPAIEAKTTDYSTIIILANSEQPLILYYQASGFLLKKLILGVFD